jgi:hypothetical protein
MGWSESDLRPGAIERWPSPESGRADACSFVARLKTSRRPRLGL